MSELLLSTVGVLVLYMVVVPILTLLGKLCLLLWRRRLPEPAEFGSTRLYLLLVSMVVGPGLWFVSAIAHMSESNRTTIVCALGHVDRELGRNALALLVVAIAIMVSAAIRKVGRANESAVPSLRLGDPDPRLRRLRRLCLAHPYLTPVVDRVYAVHGDNTGIWTLGYLRPRIEVSTQLMAQLDDQALSGALLHEAEHLRGQDPLRYLLATVCLRLNPAAFLLGPEIARWRRARELICDRVAVQAGADPFALAQALVAAARPGPDPLHRFAAPLGCGSLPWLQYRINLILGYATRPPAIKQGDLPWYVLPLLAVTLIVLPHEVNAWPLIDLHHGLEAILAFWS